MRLMFLFLIIFASCKPPINTWDPKASGSIFESKQNGFFVKEYVVGEDSLCLMINQAWVERCWKNGVADGKVYKKNIKDCFNLILKLSFKNTSLSLTDYIFEWEVINSQNKKTFGTFDGALILSLESDILPDSFNIKLINNGDTTKNSCALHLKAL